MVLLVTVIAAVMVTQNYEHDQHGLTDQMKSLLSCRRDLHRIREQATSIRSQGHIGGQVDVVASHKATLLEVNPSIICLAHTRPS